MCSACGQGAHKTGWKGERKMRWELFGGCSLGRIRRHPKNACSLVITILSNNRLLEQQADHGTCLPMFPRAGERQDQEADTPVKNQISNICDHGAPLCLWIDAGH